MSGHLQRAGPNTPRRFRDKIPQRDKHRIQQHLCYERERLRLMRSDADRPGTRPRHHTAQEQEDTRRGIHLQRSGTGPLGGILIHGESDRENRRGQKLQALHVWLQSRTGSCRDERRHKDTVQQRHHKPAHGREADVFDTGTARKQRLASRQHAGTARGRQLRRTERNTEFQLRHKSEISQTTAGEMTRRRAVRLTFCSYRQVWNQDNTYSTSQS